MDFNGEPWPLVENKSLPRRTMAFDGDWSPHGFNGQLMGINGEPWPLMENKKHSAENKDIRWRMGF